VVVRRRLLGVWAVGREVEDLRLWAVDEVVVASFGGEILPEIMSRTLLYCLYFWAEVGVLES
jgi:hypothetical protein